MDDDACGSGIGGVGLLAVGKNYGMYVNPKFGSGRVVVGVGRVWFSAATEPGMLIIGLMGAVTI